jgi:hypothetical protein
MNALTLWLLVRSLKFLGVIAYGAAVGVGLYGGDLEVRKRAIHALASPALLVAWIGGYLLTLLRGIPLWEAWVLGGFLASTACHLFLIQTTRAKSPSTRQRASVFLTLALTVLLMVFRPTWWSD